MYWDMISPVKYKHLEIDSVPSRQEVTTSSCNIMDPERMSGPQKRNCSLLRPCEDSLSDQSFIHCTTLLGNENTLKSFQMHRSVYLVCIPSAIWNRECLMMLWVPSLLYKKVLFIIVLFSWIKFILVVSLPLPFFPLSLFLVFSHSQYPLCFCVSCRLL